MILSFVFVYFAFVCKRPRGEMDKQFLFFFTLFTILLQGIVGKSSFFSEKYFFFKAFKILLSSLGEVHKWRHTNLDIF